LINRAQKVALADVEPAVAQASWLPTLPGGEFTH
jgi:hypothetical protein